MAEEEKQPTTENLESQKLEQEIALNQQTAYQCSYQLQEIEQRIAVFTEIYEELKKLTDDEVFQIIGDVMIKKKRADVLVGYEQRIEEGKKVKDVLARTMKQAQDKLDGLMKSKQ